MLHPGHVIIEDLGIVKNNKLREVLFKGPNVFIWKQNSQLVMDSVEDYARQWDNVRMLKPKHVLGG